MVKLIRNCVLKRRTNPAENSRTSICEVDIDILKQIRKDISEMNKRQEQIIELLLKQDKRSEQLSAMLLKQDKRSEQLSAMLLQLIQQRTRNQEADVTFSQDPDQCGPLVPVKVEVIETDDCETLNPGITGVAKSPAIIKNEIHEDQSLPSIVDVSSIHEVNFAVDHDLSTKKSPSGTPVKKRQKKD